MATNQDVQSLEETLERTDLGHIINDNKKPIMAAAVIVVLAIIGYVIFSSVQASKKAEILRQAYQVDQNIFAAFIDGKINDDEFKQRLAQVSTEVKGEQNLIPALLAGLNKLKKNQAMSEESLATADEWLASLDKNNEMYLLAGLAVSAHWEDFGKIDKALAHYENMIKRSSDLLKDQIFFNAGRMFLKKGERAKAEKHFDYVISEYADTQYAKLARLYLSEI